MILEFSVGNDILKRNNQSIISDKNTDYYKCNFYLKKEIWNHSIISATFITNNGYIETIELGEYEDMLSCLLPTEIVSAGHFTLYLSSNQNKKTNTIYIPLNNYYHQPKKKCNVISTIFANLNNKIDDVIYDNFQLKFYSDGTLKNVVYLGDVDYEYVIMLVNNELKKHSYADAQHTHIVSNIVDFNDTINQILDDLAEKIFNE